MESQKFLFSVGNSNCFRSKWEVGLKVIDSYIRVYWKLIHAKKSGNELKTKLKSEWCGSSGDVVYIEKVNLPFLINLTINSVT